MAFAIILYFDPAAEARVRSLWQALADQGISSIMSKMGIRPHISLAAAESLDPDRACADLSKLAQHSTPILTALSAVGTFSAGQGVVYLAPVVTAEMIELHGALNARLEQAGLVLYDYYRPAVWIPHCTTAINLLPDEIGVAVQVCRAADVFGPARLAHIALVEYMPIREICVFPLGATDHE
jgi:hypothetical protein